MKRSITAWQVRPLPPTLSSSAIDFVMSMLQYEPERRPSAAELLQHPFVKKHVGVASHAAPQPPISRDDTAYDAEVVMPEKKMPSIQVIQLL